MNDSGFIGIVGGMGPFTGVDLLDKIHQETVGVKDQEHLPVLLASYPNEIPDRGTFVLGRSTTNPAYPIARVIRLLEEAGASVLGIPCVTAHCDPIMGVVRRELEAVGSNVNLLNLVDETVRSIVEVTPNVSRVGALSTTASYEAQVFAPALRAAGLEVVLQDPEIQDTLVNPAIFDPAFGIKSGADGITEAARDHVLRAVAHLGERGAQAVILGCTELPLAVPEFQFEGIFTVDPTRALARALIGSFAPEKLRQPKTHQMA